MMNYFDNHSHTMYSNIRMLDSINRVDELLDKAIDLGLSGIAITDHECLSSHVEVNRYAKKLYEENPNIDFTIGLGNEIYLTDTRTPKQKYFHFILIAKDALGYRGIRELSSIAWLHSYKTGKMERVPLLKEELKEIMPKYKGHIIATTACIGGELGSNLLSLYKKEKTLEEVVFNIHSFISFCIKVFGRDDFYIECSPSNEIEQIFVNKNAYRISKKYDLKMSIGNDAHYLTKEDRPIHKAYLNSKEGEREVDAFYKFTYLKDQNEVIELLRYSYENNEIEQILKDTLTIKNKITFYSLENKQIIPKVDVKIDNFILLDECLRKYCPAVGIKKLPTLEYININGNDQEQYWLNECLKELINKNLTSKEYFERLETEADVIKYIGQKLDDCLFAYFNTFKHYIDLFWECGSIVGPGRGSATGFLSNYLLGITQLDPIRWDLKYWRFLNKERVELPDIDIDLAPSKRPAIFEAIRKERGDLGLVQVSTFGTETTKSAILTACRGYRGVDPEGKEMYPEGIDVSEAQYMSSMVPSHRGFLWSLSDVIHGNQELDRLPVKAFLNEVGKYPGLLDIMVRIEGLVNKRSSHASGVILYGKDPYKTSAFMKTPSGDIVTQFNLTDAEYLGDTKYDFLVTEVTDKEIVAIELLKRNGVLDKTKTLRQIYNEVLHPEVLNLQNSEIWKHLALGDILDVFQFNEGSGLAIAKKIKPRNPLEMTAANAMMRLMSEKGQESQQDRYYRIKKEGIEVFYNEMIRANLPEEIIKILYKHCKTYYGCCPFQEQMMTILMDVANFSLKEANSARKIVAKKKMKQIPELKELLRGRLPDESTFDYVWEKIVSPQLGYAFSLNHSLPYSFVGMQTIFLATNYNPIYWNTACLIVNSGAIDEASEGQTDYTKIASAIGKIKKHNIKVTLVDINKSGYRFEPDVENNQILYGFKGMLNIGDDFISEIIKNRPYKNMLDFLSKNQPRKECMLSLIKGGAFDQLEPRKQCMMKYLYVATNTLKKKITLQNMPSLMKYQMLPDQYDYGYDVSIVRDFSQARRIYEFNRYLKNECSLIPIDEIFGEGFVLNKIAIDFLESENFRDSIVQVPGNKNPIKCLIKKDWDKIYNNTMDILRDWFKGNQEMLLNKINGKILAEEWKKYCGTGNLSQWEMESMCFYYHEHELSNVDVHKYNLKTFNELPEAPIAHNYYTKTGQQRFYYTTDRICGTCIAKNKSKSICYLLDLNNEVVTVKFPKDYFIIFDKQMSVPIINKGKKQNKIIEHSWFNRGNLLLIQGVRRGDDFVAKKYARTAGHTLYHIDGVNNNGELLLRSERKNSID